MMSAFKAIIIPLWLIPILAVACIKANHQEPSHPVMQYTELKDKKINSGQSATIDIDGNGSRDFSFHTQLVGDPILQRDRLQYLVTSKISTNLLNNSHDESPRLNKGDRVGLNHDGFTWYEISSIVLTEKIIPMNEGIYWDGLWKRANHHYLPVQVTRNGENFHGWIELSFDQVGESLVLHRAAISRESNKEIKAGY